MSLSTKISRLEAAIRRLEDAVGKGPRNCPYCRYFLRYSWSDPKQGEVFKARCILCCSIYKITLAKTTKKEDEADRLFCNFTIKDQYTNPKAHAIARWLYYRLDLSEIQQNRTSAAGQARMKSKTSAEAKLLEEAKRLAYRKRKLLEAKYGRDPFPEQMERIKEAWSDLGGRQQSVDVEGLRELEQEERLRVACAELEKIIWGKTLHKTESAIERVRGEIEERIREAEEEAEARRREEERLRNLEVLKKWQARLELLSVEHQNSGP